MADEIDPRLIQVFVNDLLAEKARKAAQERLGAPLPTMPPMPYRGPEIRNLSRPGSVTLPAEQGAAEGIASIAHAPVDATRSAVELYDNAKHGDYGPAARNAMDLAILGMGARGRTPKWAREQPRFDPSQTSEIGALPFITSGVGAGLGGYGGSYLDNDNDHKGAVLGALLGGSLGFGAAMPMVRAQAQRMEDAQRAAEGLTGVGRRAPHPLDRPTPDTPTAQPETPARARLIERLRSYPTPEAAPAVEPADLVGPTGSKGTIKNSKGEPVYQDAAGNWKHEKTGRFSEPPDTEAMTHGFSDADLASARGR